LNSANTKQKTCMMRGEEKKKTWEQKWRSCSDVENVMVDPVFVCFKYFPPALYLRLLLCVQAFRTAGLTDFFFYLLRFLFTLPLLRFFLSFSLLFFSAPFSPVFSSFLCSFFLRFSTSSPRSLEGLIYSLTYLYLGKI